MKNSKATSYGQPGQSAWERGVFHVLLPLLALMLILGFSLGILLPSETIPLILRGLFPFLIITLIVGSSPKINQTLRDHIKGAEGEYAVARVLDQLPGGYTIYHSLRVRPGEPEQDIDHIVIGQGKCILIETKNWKGRIDQQGESLTVQNKKPQRNPLQQTRERVKQLQEVLQEKASIQPEIHALVVFNDADLHHDNTWACHAQELPHKILQLPQSLNDGMIERINAFCQQLYQQNKP